MSNTALLHMQAINKSYLFGKTEEIKVLDTINLELHRGEFVALVGPSGSGKTTLLNLIGCIDHSDSGEIYLDGKALHNQSEQFLKNIRRNRIGFIFQNFNLIQTLTVQENIELPLWSMNKKSEQEKLLLRKQLYTDLGIQDLLNRFPYQLSGGQQQRTAIARALISNPDIILADEPTGNLDYKTTQEIMHILKKETEKFQTSILMATHDLSLLNFADRALILRDGQLVNYDSQNSQIFFT